MKAPDNKIFYAHICENIPETCVFQDTFAQAVAFAKADQPAYRPWYIIKCVTKYEICGVIGKNGRLRRMRSE